MTWQFKGRFPTKGCVKCAIAPSDALLLRSSNQVIAYREGKIHWQVEMPLRGPGWDGIAYTDGKVLFPTAPPDAMLWAVQAHTGEVLWCHPVGLELRSSGFAVLESFVYVLGTDEEDDVHLRKIEISTGQCVADRIVNPSSDLLMVAHRELFMGNFDRLTRIDQKTLAETSLCEGSVFRVHANAQGDLIACIEGKRGTELFSFHNMNTLWQMQLSRLYYLRVTGKRSEVLLFNEEEGLAVADMEAGKILWHLKPENTKFRDVAWTPHGVMALVRASNEVQFSLIGLDLETGQPKLAPPNDEDMVLLHYVGGDLLISHWNEVRVFGWTPDAPDG